MGRCFLSTGGRSGQVFFVHRWSQWAGDFCSQVVVEDRWFLFTGGRSGQMVIH